jgi:hypothetical protein
MQQPAVITLGSCREQIFHFHIYSSEKFAIEALIFFYTQLKKMPERNKIIEIVNGIPIF